LIGGAKIWPRISPNKTWAGLLGCVVFAGLAGYGLCLIYPTMNILHVVVLSVVLSLTSQAGDFFESYIKRRSGRKDSGTLIPGHGGVLDRIDGLLSSAIFLALLLVGLSALPM
jgi:phosphatidate cytidylyltransferase